MEGESVRVPRPAAVCVITNVCLNCLDGQSIFISYGAIRLRLLKHFTWIIIINALNTYYIRYGCAIMSVESNTCAIKAFTNYLRHGAVIAYDVARLMTTELLFMIYAAIGCKNYASYTNILQNMDVCTITQQRHNK